MTVAHSPRVAHSDSTQLFSLWLAVVIIFLNLIELSFAPSLMVVAAVCILTFSGQIMLERSGFGRMGVGASFITGGGAFVLISQLLLAIGLPALLVYVVTILIHLCVILLHRTYRESYDRESTTVVPETPLLLAITILVFSIHHPWALPFGIPVALLAYDFKGKLNSSAKRLYIAPVILISWWVSSALRPDLWWYAYHTRTDPGFFEAYSWIGSEWGVGTRPGMADGSGAAYHWLSYVLFGGLSHIAWLPPWDGLMKLGVPLLTGVYASLALHSPLRSSRTGSEYLVWLLPVTAVLGWPILRVDSTNFGLFSGLCLLSLVLKQRQLALTGLRPILIIALGTVVLMLSKATTALVVGVILVLTTAYYRPRQAIASWLALLTFTITSAATYLLLFQGSTGEGFLFSPARTMEALGILTSLLLIAPSNAILIPLLLLVFLLRNSVKADNIAQLGLNLLKVGGLTATTSSISILVLSNSEQLILPSFFYLFIFCLWLLFGRDDNPLSKVWDSQWNRLLLLGALAVMFGFLWPVGANRMMSWSGIEIRDDVWEVIRELAIFIPVWLVMTFAFRTSDQTRKSMILASTMIMILGLVVGVKLDWARRQLTHGPSIYTSVSYRNDPAFPTSDLRAVGTYIRLNTDKQMILATNDFCCFGEKWWSKAVAQLPEDSNLGDALRWGNDNHLLVAESRRRILIQGLAFQLEVIDSATQGRRPSANQIERMALSLEFANRPTEGTLIKLRKFGVNGFVVNLRLTFHRDWTAYAVERFRSGNYVFLELHQE